MKIPFASSKSESEPPLELSKTVRHIVSFSLDSLLWLVLPMTICDTRTCLPQSYQNPGFLSSACVATVNVIALSAEAYAHLYINAYQGSASLRHFSDYSGFESHTVSVKQQDTLLVANNVTTLQFCTLEPQDFRGYCPKQSNLIQMIVLCV